VEIIQIGVKIDAPGPRQLSLEGWMDPLIYKDPLSGMPAVLDFTKEFRPEEPPDTPEEQETDRARE
jgi:hypothetical protein